MIFDNIFKKADNARKPSLKREEVIRFLKTNPEAFADFEKAYANRCVELLPEDIFSIDAKTAKQSRDCIKISDSLMLDIINRIVQSLIAQTKVVFQYKALNDEMSDSTAIATSVKQTCPVAIEELNEVPVNIRPQLTGEMYAKQLSGPDSYYSLLSTYKQYLEETNIQKKTTWYHIFRQGLDILDLDPVLYEMLSTNVNSMGYWLPKMIDAIRSQNSIKVPATTIIKVPLPILQLTRLEYEGLNQTTLDIVDKYCKKIFGLDINKAYFVKTGTYSSKFNFRNALVKGAEEVRTLGEYLLYIQNQACTMAGPLSSPCIYGVSTTNEWVVREYIEDKENNPTIYEGLPLHTEYRLFVDFDTKEVLSMAPYWDPETMKDRFSKGPDAGTERMIHDYITYSAYEDVLMKRYKKNKDRVRKYVQALIENVDELHGQWSIDIMQNEDDFWLIDMALAQNSALNNIPESKRRITNENWLPVIPD